MTIFVLRHGQAELQKTTDDARALTEKGCLDTKTVVSSRLKYLQQVTQIWASPLVRAQQTAQIAADLLPALPINTSPLIIPEGNLTAVMDWLQTITTENQSVLLVSHQPLVGDLVNSLCGKSEGFHPMGTSSLAAIHAPVIAAGLGELLWLDHA
jgi:phosphohistidine phosphatase